jgi:hypothetical protein
MMCIFNGGDETSSRTRTDRLYVKVVPVFN